MRINKPLKGPDTAAVKLNQAAAEQAVDNQLKITRAHGQAKQERETGAKMTALEAIVQVGQQNPQPNSVGQLLFFDRQTPLGPATPQPRPYINVVTNADDSVVVNYQWQQGQDSPKAPTGIATVRFRIGAAPWRRAGTARPTVGATTTTAQLLYKRLTRMYSTCVQDDRARSR